MSPKLDGALGDALNNPARLSDIYKLHLLDTPPEAPFDRLTRLAARVLHAPIALVSLVDDKRQFFKSAYGLPEPLASRRETPLTYSFCKYVVASASPLVIEDARLHPELRTNLAVVNLNIVAYLGMPLTTETGSTLGSFCVIDTRPRAWTPADQDTMSDLAASVMSEIALRSAYDDMRAAHCILQREMSECEHLLQSLQHSHTTFLDVQHRTSGHRIGPSEATPSQHLESSTHHATRPDPLTDALPDPLSGQRERLTKRQREVFDLLMHGLQTKDVARHLNLSHRTIEAHRAKILEHFHVNSFVQLFQQALARTPKT
jgi:DNA-binding NarL/FixJ family response regulator